MEKLNYQEIKDRLTINKHLLDDELEVQAAIQHMISELLSRSTQSVERLENELEEIESRIYINKSGELHAGKKPSVEYLKASVRTDGRRREKFLELIAARAEHERWEGLYYAWRSRNNALESLSKLAVANYFVVESTYDRNREASERNQKNRPQRRRPT